MLSTIAVTIVAAWSLIFVFLLVYTLSDTAFEPTVWRWRFRKLGWSLRRCWRALAMRVQRARTGSARVDLSRRTAYLCLFLFALSIVCIVLANWRWNAITGDTLLFVSSIDMAQRFSSVFSNANSNPLQAMFDILPSGLRLDALPNLIWLALFGPGMNVEFFYICCGILLAIAMVAMARAVGLRWGVAVLAGILMPLLSLPIFGLFPLIEHFYILWPITYYATAGTLVVTALFWQIDARSWRRAVVLTAAIALILIHLSMIQILFMTLLAPAMLAMGVGALVASHNWRDVGAKAVCAVIITVALTAAGIFHYLYAIGLDTARHVFYRELIDFMQFSAPHWTVILDDFRQLFFNPFTYNVAGTATIDGWLAPLSQLGALYLAILGKTHNARVFGWTVLAWIFATGAVIAFLHNLHFYTGLVYQGPDPRHFVPILWPYYLICLASLIFAVAEGALALLERFWPAVRATAKYVPQVLVGFMLAVPVTAIAANQVVGLVAPNRMLSLQIFPTYLPSFYAYKRNPVVEYLEQAIGVAIDRDFRGSAVLMPSDYDKDTKPYAAWRRETMFAYARAYFANDIGAFGLRYYNVPTLDLETHNIKPQFYLAVRELLSRPGIDQYDKHYALVTRLNEPIMRLFGLRYIISDYELPFGTQRLAWPIPEGAREVLASGRVYKSPVYVHELADPNVGNYAPTQVVHASSAKAVISALLDPNFDGRRTVVTDDASIGSGLMPATGVGLTVRMGGIALRASSAGQSILVLPVQYSHCWQIISGGNAHLFRANLTQLGVLFSGELQLELRQFFGPFWQSACRVADAKDAERLGMADAVSGLPP